MTRTSRSALDKYLFTPYQASHAAPSASVEEAGPKIPGTSAVGHSILRHQSAHSEAARDLRCGVLQEDARVVYAELLSAEHKEEVKTAYDLWNFLEPLFVPLTPELLLAAETPGERSAELLDSSVLTEAQGALATGEPPHFATALAVEDAIDWDAVQALAQRRMGGAFGAASSAVSSIRSSLLASFKPPPKTKRQLEADPFFQQVARLAEVHESSAALLDVLRRATELTATAEAASRQARRGIFETLVSFARQQLWRLRRQHVADALEEFFLIPAPALATASATATGEEQPQVVGVFEDGMRLRVRLMAVEEAKRLLEVRASAVEEVGEFRASGSVEWPEESGRRLGPFCHICREAKSGMFKCYAKRRCARRYCAECLRLHNFPQPTNASGTWNCTVCAHLCTCDRCVRQVYIESAETFLAGCGTDKGASEFPGQDADMELLVKLVPESHFAKNFVKANTSPIKRQVSNAGGGSQAAVATSAPSVGGARDEFETSLSDALFLTTPQQGRLRENERVVLLGKALNATRTEHAKRIGNLKNLVRIAKANSEDNDKLMQTANSPAEKMVKEFFPALRLTVAENFESPQHAKLLAEYFTLMDSITVKAKRARTLPGESGTDEEGRDEKRKIKFRKVEEIEGSVDYLHTVTPIGCPAATDKKDKPLQFLAFSAGIASAKLRRR